jgi:hypothetical protein
MPDCTGEGLHLAKSRGAPPRMLSAWKACPTEKKPASESSSSYPSSRERFVMSRQRNRALHPGNQATD